EVGIDAHGILTGAQIEAMTDNELEREVETRSVFAKLTPLQKSRILKTLQKNGHTVGFLGDGINDAPALRDAEHLSDGTPLREVMAALADNP
ncbi:HAD family hydrolase, partial [Xanthomonas citri pv. citri]|nr:HAD family hydrolase [Xanthomonas citri pv. citri]